jgi:hypothetical protein
MAEAVLAPRQLRPQAIGVDVAAPFQRDDSPKNPVDFAVNRDTVRSESPFGCRFSREPSAKKPAVAPTDLVETPQRPAWVKSVSELSGAIGVARIDPAKLPHLAERLNRNRVDYYWPRQRVRRQHGRTFKVWTRSLFAGTIFVACGASGWDSAADFAFHCGWRISWLHAHNSAQDRLRSDLVAIEQMLGYDPSLTTLVRVKPGMRVRIVAGALMGLQGFVTGHGSKATFWLDVAILGRSVAVQIAREFVEPI